MFIRGMKGLGDNIYQRAFVRQIRRQVFLETPWPELYQDMPHVQCVRPATKLRTQAKNIARQSHWVRPPTNGAQKRIHYGAAGIYAGMRQCFRLEPGLLDLPNFGPSPVSGRYVVVRPVTVREEWRADARNPLPEYVASAAEQLRKRGYQVVSVADLQPGKEWALQPLPGADIRYHAGELPVDQLLALLQGAAAVVGGVGWIVPASVAAGVPAWIVCGGQGGYNAPELLTDPAMNTEHITFALPDNFCRCTERYHTCDKRIVDYDQRLAEWADRLPAVV